MSHDNPSTGGAPGTDEVLDEYLLGEHADDSDAHSQPAHWATRRYRFKTDLITSLFLLE